MPDRILVVDRNEAFSAMLKELLEIDGGYEVEAVHSGREAVMMLQRSDFDLTIVDMDLTPTGSGYRELIEQVREIRPLMRLVLIPLMGEKLPAEARQYQLQGTLSKPFFADDLLPRIEKALSTPVGLPSPAQARPVEPAPEPESPANNPATAPSSEEEVHAVLADLARETRADVVLLVSAKEGDERILAQLSVLERVDLAELAALSITTLQTAQATAQLLGQPDEPFEHNVFESRSLRLYIMTLPAEVLLVIVAPMSTALGAVRHNLRRAGRDLASLSLT
jgi:CheY-like chemotaxis protein